MCDSPSGCFLCGGVWSHCSYTDSPFGVVESWQSCKPCQIVIGHSYGLYSWAYRDHIYLQWHCTKPEALYEFLDALFEAWCCWLFQQSQTKTVPQA